MKQFNNLFLHTSKIILASLALALFVAALASLGGFSADPARAAEGDNVSGWAWSDTIGWISFYGNNYGVDINDDPASPSYGAFSGYAWSDATGWINFAPDADNAPEAPKRGASVNFLAAGDLKPVTGWARACSVLSSSDCSGTDMKSDTALGGWDGWIKMSGDWTDSVTLDTATNKFEGYAWGSDPVGWISMSGASPNYAVVYGGVVSSPAIPIVWFDLASQNVASGGTAFAQWHIKNFKDGACSVIDDTGAPVSWSSIPNPIPNADVIGTESVNNVTARHVYTLTCGPAFATFTVNVNPFFSKFEANPPAVFTGESTMLSWQTENIPSGTCTGTSNPSDSGWNGGGKSLLCDSSICGQVTPVASAGATQAYTLNCPGVSKSISVPVKQSGFWLGAEPNQMSITIIGEGTTITGGKSSPVVLTIHPDETFDKHVTLTIDRDPFSSNPGSGYSYKFRIVPLEGCGESCVAGSVISNTVIVDASRFFNDKYGIEFWLESNVELPARTENKITIKGAAVTGPATDFLDINLDSRAFNPEYREI